MLFKNHDIVKIDVFDTTYFIVVKKKNLYTINIIVVIFNKNVFIITKFLNNLCIFYF